MTCLVAGILGSAVCSSLGFLCFGQPAAPSTFTRCLSLWLCFPPCGPVSTDCNLLLFFQNLTVCPEEESVIMSSFVSTLSSLNLKQGKW